MYNKLCINYVSLSTVMYTVHVYTKYFGIGRMVKRDGLHAEV